jgi:hypothetical protein
MVVAIRETGCCRGCSNFSPTLWAAPRIRHGVGQLRLCVILGEMILSSFSLSAIMVRNSRIELFGARLKSGHRRWWCPSCGAATSPSSAVRIEGDCRWPFIRWWVTQIQSGLPARSCLIVTIDQLVDDSDRVLVNHFASAILVPWIGIQWLGAISDYLKSWP